MPYTPDDFRRKYGRYKERGYIDALPADETWPADDTIYPSVTTVLKAYPMALDYWAAGEVAAFAYDYRDNWATLPRDAAVPMMAAAANRVRDQGAERGTALHSVAEAIGAGREPSPLDTVGIEPLVTQLRNYVEDWQPRSLMREAVVFKRGPRGYGGTADSLDELRAVKYIFEGLERHPVAGVDYKSRGPEKDDRIWEKEAAQLAAYFIEGDYYIDLETGTRQLMPAIDELNVVSISATGYTVHVVKMDEARAHWYGVREMFESLRCNPILGPKLNPLRAGAEAPEALPVPGDPFDDLMGAAMAVLTGGAVSEPVATDGPVLQPKKKRMTKKEKEALAAAAGETGEYDAPVDELEVEAAPAEVNVVTVAVVASDVVDTTTYPAAPIPDPLVDPQAAIAAARAEVDARNAAAKAELEERNRQAAAANDAALAALTAAAAEKAKAADPVIVDTVAAAIEAFGADTEVLDTADEFPASVWRAWCEETLAFYKTEAPEVIHRLGRLWPADIPGLKVSQDHTAAQLRIIVGVIEKAIGASEAPFGPSKPSKPVEAPTIVPPAPAPYVLPSSPIPEGVNINEGDHRATTLRLSQLEPHVATFVQALAIEAHAAGYPFSIKQVPSIRRNTILQAVIDFATKIGCDRTTLASFVEAVLEVDTLTHPVALHIGAMTNRQARALSAMVTELAGAVSA